MTTAKYTLVGYHGTSSVHVLPLLQGINPQTGLNFGGDSQLGEGFYTTMDRAHAQVYAYGAVVQSGGVPMILSVQAADFDQMTYVEVPSLFWWRTPQVFITDFDYLIAPISGFEHIRQIKFNPRAYGKIRIFT